MSSLKEEARKAAMRDITKYEGQLGRHKNFVGHSGYKSEGYSPIKREISNKPGVFDPSDAPYDYNFLVGFCVSESQSVIKDKF